MKNVPVAGRDKKFGTDPCVEDKPCGICDQLTDREVCSLLLNIKLAKTKNLALLVSPSKVTVVGVVDQDTVELEEDVPAHSSTGSGQQELFAVSHHSADEFVSKQDFDLPSNQLEEKFARFEALLTCTNIFSTPKVPVSIYHCCPCP